MNLSTKRGARLLSSHRRRPTHGGDGEAQRREHSSRSYLLSYEHPRAGSCEVILEFTPRFFGRTANSTGVLSNHAGARTAPSHVTDIRQSAGAYAVNLEDCCSVWSSERVHGSAGGCRPEFPGGVAIPAGLQHRISCCFCGL